MVMASVFMHAAFESLRIFIRKLINLPPKNFFAAHFCAVYIFLNKICIMSVNIWKKKTLTEQKFFYLWQMSSLVE